MGNLQDRGLIQGDENLKKMSRDVSACMLEKSLYVGVSSFVFFLYLFFVYFFYFCIFRLLLNAIIISAVPFSFY